MNNRMVMGFKALSISYEETLCSPRGYNTWDDRGVIFAKCKKTHSVVPDEDCSCGIYGAFRFSDCTEYIGQRSALFLIRGFGKCIVGESGFRAELAQIVFIVEKSWHGNVIYNQIGGLLPALQHISLESADAMIREHCAQWLALRDESEYSAKNAKFTLNRQLRQSIPAPTLAPLQPAVITTPQFLSRNSLLDNDKSPLQPVSLTTPLGDVIYFPNCTITETGSGFPSVDSGAGRVYLAKIDTPCGNGFRFYYRGGIRDLQEILRDIPRYEVDQEGEVRETPLMNYNYGSIFPVHNGG